ncbi:hypothetical protein DL769_010672 [Monosporascus sp. CRB-8-3]|nr:hypothetical protein DL769_010672 [Monosporascus sp. CRB-8-3]
MATRWAKNIDSDLFTFVVGPEGKEFTIHSGAVLHLSPYFEALIHGSMKEARDRRVVWDDIDEETFVTFCQFAYAGHYDTPEYPAFPPELEKNEVAKSSDPISSQMIELAKSSYTFRSHTFDLFCSSPKRTILEWEQDFRAKLDEKQKVETAVYCILKDFVELPCGRSYRYTIEPNISARSFLLHAKLYILADRYCIDTLKDMAIGRLHRTLLLVPLDLYASDCFCELVRFAYANTRPTEDLDQDDLRCLLVAFGACVFDWFLHNSAFKDVLRDHGEFGLGIIIKLSPLQDKAYRTHLKRVEVKVRSS